MSVHSFPIKRPFGESAGTLPASASPVSRIREPLRRVLIRHPWVTAIDEPAAPDLDNSHTVDVGGETRLRRAA